MVTPRFAGGRALWGGPGRAVIGCLFGEEGMDYVQCGYFAFNAVSAALQEKLGFTHLTTMTLDFKGAKTVTVENVLWRDQTGGA